MVASDSVTAAADFGERLDRYMEIPRNLAVVGEFQSIHLRPVALKRATVSPEAEHRPEVIIPDGRG